MSSRSFEITSSTPKIGISSDGKQSPRNGTFSVISSPLARRGGNGGGGGAAGSLAAAQGSNRHGRYWPPEATMATVPVIHSPWAAVERSAFENPAEYHASATVSDGDGYGQPVWHLQKQQDHSPPQQNYQEAQRKHLTTLQEEEQEQSSIREQGLHRNDSLVSQVTRKSSRRRPSPGTVASTGSTAGGRDEVF